MQISKINSANFKGLWEFKTTQREERSWGYRSAIYVDEVIYHPFSDETPEKIQETMENAKKTPVYEGRFSSGFFGSNPFCYVITKHSLGDKLNITQEEYENIQNMKQTPKPKSNNTKYYDYLPSQDRSHPIQKIMDENDIKE